MLSLRRKFDHMPPVLKDLHWLPVEQIIEYKVPLLTYKALHGEAPPYIPVVVSVYSNQALAIREQKSPQSAKMLFGMVW